MSAAPASDEFLFLRGETWGFSGQLTEAQEDLRILFDGINREWFDGLLPLPDLKWNSRLRTSAGRFTPGSRKSAFTRAPLIEVATYLLEEGNAMELVWDTMAHEMIHFWLWVRRHPYGHTPEFMAKMNEMGVSRYNPVPRRRPYRYLYRCFSCSREFPARRKLGQLACAWCCNQHAGGRYDHRFKLVLYRTLTESPEPPESVSMHLR